MVASFKITLIIRDPYTHQGLSKDTIKHICIRFHNYSNKTIVEVDSELIDKDKKYIQTGA